MIWKDIVGYEGLYSISETGIIKRHKKEVITKEGKKLPFKERVLIPYLNKYGYLCTNLTNSQGKREYAAIHRLVAIAFLESTNRDINNLQVNHIDGVKTNNAYSNLEWVTAKENILHSHKIGLRNYKSKKVGKYMGDVLVEVYNSTKEAAERNNRSKASITQYCTGTRGTNKKIRFKYIY